VEFIEKSIKNELFDFEMKTFECYKTENSLAMKKAILSIRLDEGLYLALVSKPKSPT
jgi:hypothetical protein